MSLLDSFLIMFETDSSDAAKDVDNLNKKLGDTESKANDAVDGMDAASDASEDMSVNLLEAAKSAGILYASFATLSAMKDQIDETASLTDRIGKLSETYDWNISRVDAWGSAIEKSGGSADSLFGSVINMQNQLEQIKFGGGTEIIKQLGLMGISAVDATGQIKDSFAIMEELAGSSEHMSKKQFAAMGESLGLDQSTILMLQQGRNTLKQLVDGEEALGSATQENARVSADYNDSLADLDRSFTSVWRIINNAVLPVFTDLIDGFVDIIQWAKKNENFVVGTFTAIATAITYVALPAVLSLTAAAWALAAPFLAVIVPIVAVGAALGLLYDDMMAFLNGQKSMIGSIISGLGWLKDQAIALFNGMWDGIADMFDWSAILIDKPIVALSQLVSKFKSDFTMLWDFIKGMFDFSFVSDAIGDIKGELSLVADFLGFGEDAGSELNNSYTAEETVNNNTTIENTRRIMETTYMYGVNPLNNSGSNYSYGQKNINNNFNFNNNIKAGGVTKEQVSGVLVDDLGRQIASANSMLDDGVYQ